MIRAFQIAVLACLPFCLTGCGVPEENEPIWQQFKIGDLAPSHSAKGPDGQLLKTANFNVYIFEIPAENISVLDHIWRMLYSKPLQFNNYEAFKANSFLAGFGQAQMWSKIIDLLLAAFCKVPDGLSFAGDTAKHILDRKCRNQLLMRFELG